MAKLLGGLITVVLVIFLATLFLGSVTVRFNLITVHPAFWLYALGIIFVLGGGWLVAAEVPAGGFFATLGSILLLLGGYKTIWPNTAKASAHAQEVADSRIAAAITKAVAPRPVRCDRDSDKTVYWDPVNGKALVFFTTNDRTGRIDCADSGGFDPVSRQEYEPVTPAVVRLIRMQAPAPEEPKATPSPAPAPTVQPAPVQLGEGLIAQVPRQ